MAITSARLKCMRVSPLDGHGVWVTRFCLVTPRGGLRRGLGAVGEVCDSGAAPDWVQPPFCAAFATRLCNGRGAGGVRQGTRRAGRSDADVAEPDSSAGG